MVSSKRISISMCIIIFAVLANCQHPRDRTVYGWYESDFSQRPAVQQNAVVYGVAGARIDSINGQPAHEWSSLNEEDPPAESWFENREHYFKTGRPE